MLHHSRLELQNRSSYLLPSLKKIEKGLDAQFMLTIFGWVEAQNFSFIFLNLPATITDHRVATANRLKKKFSAGTNYSLSRSNPPFVEMKDRKG
jgi:hypothetical protein